MVCGVRCAAEPVLIVAAKVNGAVRDLRQPLLPSDLKPDPANPSSSGIVRVDLVPENTPDGKAVRFHVPCAW